MQTEQGSNVLASLNPATHAEVGEVTVSNPAQVADTVRRSRAAQKAWGSMPLKERGAVLKRVGQVFADRSDELAELLIAENGKTRFESYAADIYTAVAAFHWVAKNAPKYLADEKVSHTTPFALGKKSHFIYEPKGVIGIIAPWNFPLAIPGSQVAYSLAAGNGVVVKPSEFTPLIADKIREFCEEGGVPKDLVGVVHGFGDVGASLVTSGVDKIIFTGSVRTGRKVAVACAEAGVACTLELGGKDAAIVRADADIDKAVEGVLFASFFNCGQVCASIERIYVHEQVADEFTSKFAERAASIRVGDPSSADTDMGPMIHDGQAQIVRRHIAGAVDRGATVLAGGDANTGLPGSFVKPTVLTDVPDDAEIHTEETFGPALGIRRVSSDDEAVKLANNSEFGLTASIWTRDTSKAREMARHIEAGTVYINDALTSYASHDMPWAGVKESGSGVTHSRFGLYELVNVKNVQSDPGLLPLGYPYSVELADAVSQLTKAFYGSGGRLKFAIAGAKNMLAAVRKQKKSH